MRLYIAACSPDLSKITASQRTMLGHGPKPRNRSTNFFLAGHKAFVCRCTGAPYFPLAPGGHSTGGGFAEIRLTLRGQSVLPRICNSHPRDCDELAARVAFSCAIVASPRPMSPMIVAALKPRAASNGPVTPLRPAPASKPSARRCAELRSSAVWRVRRNGAGGFLRGLCMVNSRAREANGPRATTVPRARRARRQRAVASTPSTGQARERAAGFKARQTLIRETPNAAAISACPLPSWCILRTVSTGTDGLRPL
jgi:hypothetical protein